MRRKISITVGIAATCGLALLLLGGCASTRTAGTQLDDSVITTKVKAKLAADPGVGALGIDVDTLDGVVTLSGNVETDAQHDQAERVAQGVEGVREVENELSVDSPQTAGEQLDDATITTKVNAQLIDDELVEARNIDVDTRDGVVTLRGRVYTDAERERAAEVARGVDGVRDVVNRLEVGDDSGW